MGGTVYPFVGGHEILGRVLEVGEGVDKVKVGEVCGVGCMVESCLNCDWCISGEE